MQSIRAQNATIELPEQAKVFILARMEAWRNGLIPDNLTFGRCIKHAFGLAALEKEIESNRKIKKKIEGVISFLNSLRENPSKQAVQDLFQGQRQVFLELGGERFVSDIEDRIENKKQQDVLLPDENKVVVICERKRPKREPVTRKKREDHPLILKRKFSFWRFVREHKGWFALMLGGLAVFGGAYKWKESQENARLEEQNVRDREVLRLTSPHRDPLANEIIEAGLQSIVFKTGSTVRFDCHADPIEKAMTLIGMPTSDGGMTSPSAIYSKLAPDLQVITHAGVEELARMQSSVDGSKEGYQAAEALEKDLHRVLESPREVASLMFQGWWNGDLVARMEKEFRLRVGAPQLSHFAHTTMRICTYFADQGTPREREVDESLFPKAPRNSTGSYEVYELNRESVNKPGESASSFCFSLFAPVISQVKTCQGKVYALPASEAPPLSAERGRQALVEKLDEISSRASEIRGRPKN